MLFGALAEDRSPVLHNKGMFVCLTPVAAAEYINHKDTYVQHTHCHTHTHTHACTHILTNTHTHTHTTHTATMYSMLARMHTE